MIKSFFRKLIIILIPVCLILLIMLGFHIEKITSHEYRLFKPVIDSTSLELSYCDYEINPYTQKDMYRCTFDVYSDDVENIGEQLKIIYDQANKLLKSQNIKTPIEINISTERIENGCNRSVAFFTNCEKNISLDRKINDHISSIRSEGITVDMEMFEDNYDYEINHREYWDYFSDVDELNVL